MARREADPKRSGAWGRGRLAELTAGIILTFKGYRILEKRWRTHSAEIDLIAKRGRTLVFIEVKARAHLPDAELALTTRQRRRITQAAELYLAKHPAHRDCAIRYDLVLVSKTAWPRHIQGAFDANF